MRNQALALAGALGLAFVEPPVRRRWSLDLLPPALFASRRVLAAHGLVEPLPDLVIGSGRYAGRLSAALKRIQPGIRNVQIQDPRSERHRFDLIVTPAHDRLRGGHVIHTLGALHAMTPERLRPDAAAWANRLAGDGRLLAVLIGGPTRRAPYTATEVAALCADLRELTARGGWRVAVCASRRSPPWLGRQIAAGLGGRVHLLWLGDGDNPYRGLLAQADAFLVSADSVNMASEALGSGRPVQRWGEPVPGSRVAHFHAALEARGLVTPWRGRPEGEARAPLDELTAVAARVAQRLGLSLPGGVSPPGSTTPGP
jgi:mitochondrial fission protein ELM1